MNSGQAETNSTNRSHWNSIICLQTRSMNCSTAIPAKLPAQSLNVYAWLRERQIPQQGMATGSKYKRLLSLCSSTFHYRLWHTSGFPLGFCTREKNCTCLEKDALADSAPTLSFRKDNHPIFLSKLCHLVWPDTVVSCLLLFWKSAWLCGTDTGRDLIHKDLIQPVYVKGSSQRSDNSQNPTICWFVSS